MDEKRQKQDLVPVMIVAGILAIAVSGVIGNKLSAIDSEKSFHESIVTLVKENGIDPLRARCALTQEDNSTVCVMLASKMQKAQIHTGYLTGRMEFDESRDMPLEVVEE